MQDTLIAQNIIITESSRNLRALGRNALEGRWKLAILTVIIYLLCTSLPTVLFNNLFGAPIGDAFTNSGYTYGIDVDVYTQMYNSMPRYSLLSSVYAILVSGPMSLGLYMFFLACFRRHETSAVDVFLGFEKFGKAVGLLLMMGIRIFLWSLLFIIPGVIAALRYSQAFYIMADDPSKSIRQCINESKFMMKGNKMKYFLLSLSFIGWIFLSAVPAGIVQSMGTVVSSSALVIALFAFAGSLFTAPVSAYSCSTMAGFYEILAGHLIKETLPVPVTAQEAEELKQALEAEIPASEEEAEREENDDVHKD